MYGFEYYRGLRIGVGFVLEPYRPKGHGWVPSGKRRPSGKPLYPKAKAVGFTGCFYNAIYV